MPVGLCAGVPVAVADGDAVAVRDTVHEGVQARLRVTVAVEEPVELNVAVG